MVNDKDETQAEQRDVPGGEASHVAERSWASLLASDANEVAVGAAVVAVSYGAKKIADHIHKPPPSPPPPPPPAGSGGEQ